MDRLLQVLHEYEFSDHIISGLVQDYTFRMSTRSLMKDINDLPPELIEMILHSVIKTSCKNRLVSKATCLPAEYYGKPAKGRPMTLIAHKAKLKAIVKREFASEMVDNVFGGFYGTYKWKLFLVNEIRIPAWILHSIDVSRCKCKDDIGRLEKFCDKLVNAYKENDEIRETVETYFRNQNKDERVRSYRIRT